jgi:uncharacterized RDD family membrane protein YckC
MTACPVCDAEVPTGLRWCVSCHLNVLNPTVGLLAAPVRRLAAHGLDIVIPGVALSLIFGVSAAGGGRGGAGVTIGVLLLLGYAVWALLLFSRGTTPGKKAFGMRVVREDGRPAPFLVMLVREWIGKPISSLVFSLGFVWILIDRDRQGWHDKLVNTYVVV